MSAARPICLRTSGAQALALGDVLLRAGLERRPAKLELVPVEVVVGDLADAVRQGLGCRGLQSAPSDLRDERVEVVNKHEAPGVPGTLGLLLDEDEPMLGELPHSLVLGGHERRWGAEESFVPLQGRRELLTGIPAKRSILESVGSGRAGEPCWALAGAPRKGTVGGPSA
jgi:hypothetical protein